MYKCTKSLHIDNTSFDLGKHYYPRYQYPDTILIYGENMNFATFSRNEQDKNYFGNHFEKVC